MNFKNFIEERNEAFASFDDKKIKAYMKKYKIEIPHSKKVYEMAKRKTVTELYVGAENHNGISKELFDQCFIELAMMGAESPFIGGFYDLKKEKI